MGKIAVLALLVIGLVFWLRLKIRAKTPPPDSSSAARAGGAEAMVSCASCGIYLPASEAVLGRSARTYCGAAHRANAQDGPA